MPFPLARSSETIVIIFGIHMASCSLLAQAERGNHTCCCSSEPHPTDRAVTRKT